MLKTLNYHKNKIFNKVKLSFLLTLFPATFLFANTQRVITVGWDSWVPYYYLDNGVLTGLDIDIVKAIGDKAGYTLDFQEMPWVRNLHSVKLGEVDLAISASKTSEREEYAYFGEPYRLEEVGMFIRKEVKNKFTFKTLKDIIGTGFRLGATRGYYYGPEFDTIVNNPEFVKLIDFTSNDDTHVRKAAIKRLDGFILDIYSGTYIIKQKKLQNDIVVYPMAIYSATIHIMFSKISIDPKIVEDFDKALLELKNDGTIEKITRKYSL
jgi:polar amino acid transport system substrate-binding protein